MFTSVLLSGWLWLVSFFPAPVTDKPAIATETIPWAENRRLSWNDFKANPDTSDPLDAITSANIDVKITCQNNKLNYQVTSVFVASDSWSKDKESDALLHHEQMHFDLTEIHARLLRKKLSLLKDPCSMPQPLLNKAINDQFDAWKKEQDRYDNDTNHGLKEMQQLIWSKQIADRLQELKAYRLP